MTRSVRVAYFDLPGAAKSSAMEHERIVESLAARDTTRAARLIRQHYRSSSKRWKRDKI